MNRFLVFALCSAVVLSCKDIKSSDGFASIDTISSDQFLEGRDICRLTLATGFRPIKPEMIAWAVDSNDPYSETYLIHGSKLKIIQPIKFDSTDSIRRYFYADKKIKTVRVVFDSLEFNFNSVFFDFGDSPDNIFQSEDYVLLRNAPVAWSGLANRFRFIQMFDLKKLTCYEFFVDYYACLDRPPR